MTKILIHGGSIYAPGNPDATSAVIDGNHFAWIGDRISSTAFVADVDYVLDFEDAFIAPGFVDAHVHLSATGLLYSECNLRDSGSATQALTTLRDFVQKNNPEVVYAHGWDDTNWLDKGLFTQNAIDQIVGRRFAYLSRVDLHSAMCSTYLLESVQVPANEIAGLVHKSSHAQVREFVLRHLSSQQRSDAIEFALKQASANGIVSVHENGGPSVSGEQDFLSVNKVAQRNDVPRIFSYWADQDLDRVKSIGAYGSAGDLCIDGSIGSQTALISSPYEGTDSKGSEYLSQEQISRHLVDCTTAGIQAGFHAIGDRAIDMVSTGIAQAIAKCGIVAVRTLRHRVEHALLASAESLKVFANAGVILSMQPNFTHLWGHENGMYEQNLGRQRAQATNPFFEALNMGIVLAFGTDSPVTAMNPWQTLKAATTHPNPSQRLSMRAAFVAHTRGGWRAVHDDESGVIALGAPAHFTVWNVQSFEPDEDNEVVASWSTDARSGMPALPNLSSDLPSAVLTVLSGHAIFDPNGLWPDG